MPPSGTESCPCGGIGDVVDEDCAFSSTTRIGGTIETQRGFQYLETRLAGHGHMMRPPCDNVRLRRALGDKRGRV